MLVRGSECPPFLPVPWVLAVLLLGAGCLPHSCGGAVDSGALTPADSLSRSVAQAVPMDTLRPVWRVDASAEMPLRFPRTALFLPDADGDLRLAVSDAEQNALLLFSAEGQLVRTVAPTGEAAFAAPYLIGRRTGAQADTLLVLNPRARRVDFVPLGSSGTDGGGARSVTLALPPIREAPLLWATATGEAIFAKTIDADGQAAVTRHGAGGQVAARQALGGPRWHHAGPLHPWRGGLLSLSGFRPVAHRLAPDLDGAVDTLRLLGFDSPMLARTRRFAEGDTRQPPLLLPGVATAGGWLFALNLRAGRLRIDVFGPEGRLRHRLAAPGPARGRDVYPRALAAHRRPDGSVALAVALTAPQPSVVRYRWEPEGSG